VRGITTNPKLMAASGRPPLDQLQTSPNGPLFVTAGLSSASPETIERGGGQKAVPTVGSKT
jgi:hypothetical protein